MMESAAKAGEVSLINVAVRRDARGEGAPTSPTSEPALPRHLASSLTCSLSAALSLSFSIASYICPEREVSRPW